MAPNLGDMAPFPNFGVYKSYFDNPKYSDLKIRFGGKTIYAHKVILCTQSEYFEKLIEGPFKESGQKKIELHEDDPEVMTALFRYVYDSSYHDLWEGKNSPLQFLAKVYAAGEKYMIKGLGANVAMHMDSYIWDDTMFCFSYPLRGETKDLLEAVKIIMAGTPSNDVVGRRVVVRFCAAYIYELRPMPEFVNLLEEYPELGASILQVPNLDLMSQGCWHCNAEEDRRAVPRCRQCDETFPVSYMREHRTEELWDCSFCQEKVQPVCTEHNGAHWIEWHWHSERSR